MSLAVSGEKNGMYGKKHTEESKQKMSEHKKGKKMNSEKSNTIETAGFTANFLESNCCNIMIKICGC